MVKRFRTHVRRGRLRLNEPTNLPEGELVLIVVVTGTTDDVVIIDDDTLDEKERSQLTRDLRASIDEADQGETVDFAEVLAVLRGQRRREK